MQHATTAYGTHEMFHKQWSSPIKDGCLPLRLRPHWPPWSLKEELSLFLPRGFNSSCSPVWKVPSLFYATAASSLAFGPLVKYHFLWTSICRGRRTPRAAGGCDTARGLRGLGTAAPVGTGGRCCAIPGTAAREPNTGSDPNVRQLSSGHTHVVYPRNGMWFGHKKGRKGWYTPRCEWTLYILD